jgi:hypothetical protein
MTVSMAIRARLTSLLVAAVCARALVPLGYMPAGAGSDLWFELCPDGLPQEVARYLAGTDDHGHHEHGDEAGEAHTCPLGHMLAAAAAVDHSEAVPLADARPLPPVLLDYEFTTRSINHYRSRGPPS